MVLCQDCQDELAVLDWDDRTPVCDGCYSTRQRTLCPDCEEAPGVKAWHNSREEVWWMCGRLPAVEQLCEACWTRRDNREGREPSYDPIGYLEDCTRRAEEARKLK